VSDEPQVVTSDRIITKLEGHLGEKRGILEYFIGSKKVDYPSTNVTTSTSDHFANAPVLGGVLDGQRTGGHEKDTYGNGKPLRDYDLMSTLTMTLKDRDHAPRISARFDDNQDVKSYNVASAIEIDLHDGKGFKTLQDILLEKSGQKKSDFLLLNEGQENGYLQILSNLIKHSPSENAKTIDPAAAQKLAEDLGQLRAKIQFDAEVVGKEHQASLLSDRSETANKFCRDNNLSADKCDLVHGALLAPLSGGQKPPGTKDTLYRN
jgi:hypothetical protein